VGSGVRRTGSALHLAVFLLLLLAAHGASAAGPGFTPQKRIGHTTGDQWEPTLAADSHGHVLSSIRNMAPYGIVPAALCLRSLYW
jgi:hypothetical protein